MREIKYKIWDVKNKKMLTFEDEESDNFLMCPFTGALYDHSSLLYRRDFKRLQFTGLKDKNGKDIYEGDILLEETDGAIPFEIKWEQEQWVEDGFVSGFTCLSAGANCYTIVGNIYEPESLPTERGQK